MNKIKKILLIGHFSKNPKVYTYASSFASTLQELGYTVKKEEYRKTFLNPSNKVARSLALKICNSALKFSATTFKPDVVFIIKGETISPKTIIFFKEKIKAKVINFYPDNPFAVWNANSTPSMLYSLPHFDLFLSWSKQLMPILESAGCKNVGYFPFAYDQNIFGQEVFITPEETIKYASDVCFAGTWEPEREHWLNVLVEKMPQISLAIWGNGWKENIDKNSSLKRYLKGDATYCKELIKIFRSSKIVLNFIRKQNLDSHNMRTLEVPASKAFLLTQRTKEQTRDFFVEDAQIACFGSITELVEKISYYLQHESERLKIATYGFDVAKKFTLQKYLRKLFQKEFES